MRESRFRYRHSILALLFDESKAIECVRVWIIGRVFHHSLLGYTDPVVCGDVCAIGERERFHDFAGHAN